MNRIAFLFILFTNILLAQNEFKHVVYFDTDQYVVPSTEKNRILLFIQKISEVEIDKIEIFGFCDDRGSDNYNLILSQQRADAIKSIFSSNNIEESRITNVDGRGEILLNIVFEDDLNEIRGLNRKVEVIVKPIVKKVEPLEVTDSKPKDIDKLIKDDVKVGDKILLKNLLFKVNYSYLEPESKKVLEKIAKELMKRDDVHFIIQGHVCCTENGRDAVDRRTRKRNLSVARAKHVYDYLVRKGVSKSRMKYVGLRRKFPLGKEEKFDRRVEILVAHIAEKN